ncbi:MAG: dephospho-CoA kinase [Clostridia bacterium]|nr:dephospho-CoA kinase [Clostridia bacterium]
MRVIGLTGSIACGKSTVSQWLREQPGCRILDGDQLSRQLTAPSGAAIPFIREAFGSAVFLPDGTLNRRQLGHIVFENSEARKKLDTLMAPLLWEKTEQALAAAREDGVSLCFLDYPLLFEKRYDRLCDSVWCVWLPRPLQLQRLMARDHLSEQEALQRMDAVLSSDDKAERSTVIIDNSGSVSYTLSLLPPLLEAERQKAETTPSRRRRRTETRSRRTDSEPSSVPPAASLSSDADFRHTVSSPARSPATEEAPASMDRPPRSRRGPSTRKIQWHLPSWLLTSMIVCVSLLLLGFTAQALMSAYLTKQSEAHLSDAQAVLRQYPLEYRDLITAGAEENNLQPAFVAAIIRNESSFQPRAESGVGARGLMQLMPETAQWIADKTKMTGYAFDRMYDPESNIRFGCWYLNYLSRLFQGDPICVACAYHAGQGQVTAWLSDPSLSSDGVKLNLDAMADGPTKTYARRVIKAYGIYQTLYFSGSDVYDVLLPRFGQ